MTERQDVPLLFEWRDFAVFILSGKRASTGGAHSADMVITSVLPLIELSPWERRECDVDTPVF